MVTDDIFWKCFPFKPKFQNLIIKWQTCKHQRKRQCSIWYLPHQDHRIHLPWDIAFDFPMLSFQEVQQHRVFEVELPEWERDIHLQVHLQNFYQNHKYTIIRNNEQNWEGYTCLSDCESIVLWNLQERRDPPFYINLIPFPGVQRWCQLPSQSIKKGHQKILIDSTLVEEMKGHDSLHKLMQHARSCTFHKVD